jgi:hypothetical protein
MARQNGKSTVSQVLALWFMYVYGRPLVIGTAQDLDVAEEIWQGAVDLVEETPELDALKKHVIRVNGKKSLVLTTGERYKVKAANRRAGRGLSGDLVMLDELREHQSGTRGARSRRRRWPGTTPSSSPSPTPGTPPRWCSGTCASWRTPPWGTRTGSTGGRRAGPPDDEPGAGRRRRLARHLRVVRPTGSGPPGPQGRMGRRQPGARLHDQRAHHRLGCPHRPRVDFPHRGPVPVVRRHLGGPVPARLLGGLRGPRLPSVPRRPRWPCAST